MPSIYKQSFISIPFVLGLEVAYTYAFL